MIKSIGGIQYQLTERLHPEFEGMSARDIRKVINIDDGEEVPKLNVIEIIRKPMHIPITDAEEKILKEEGFTEGQYLFE